MFALMGGRYTTLFGLVMGLKDTNVPFITTHNGLYGPLNVGDDLGIFYFIPKLVLLLNISVDQAINVFFFGLLFVFFLLSLIGFFLLFKSFVCRIVIIIGLLLICKVIVGIGGVYTFSAFCPMFIVPFSIYFFYKQKGNFLFILFFVFASGFFVGLSHYMRAFSGMPAILFLFAMLIGCKFYKLKNKLIFIFIILIGMLIPKVHFDLLVKKRDDFLISRKIAYIGKDSHVFWHNVLGGLGYLDNEFGFKYSDGPIAEKVYEKFSDVHCPTQEYDIAARKCLFNFVFTRQGFLLLLNTVFAKLGVIFLYLLVFSNIGLICLFFSKNKYFLVNIAFVVSLLLAMLPGILTVPWMPFMLGFIACATLFGVVNMCNFIELHSIGEGQCK